MLLTGYLLVMGLLMIFEEHLIFHPFRYPRGEWQPRFKFEDATFTAADGTKLHGWFLPHDKPRHVVLFAHGNAGNVAMWGPDGDQLRHLGESAVLVFDYRGFGRSEGSPTEQGVLADARAARAWLAQRTGVREQEIVLAGRSLGTGVLVDLAARDGAKALMLTSPFTSLPDVAAIHYPFVPARWIMRSRLDSLSLIDRFRGPTLILHGDADSLIPLSHGERLFAAANDPKRLVVLRGSGHNDGVNREGLEAMREFLRSLP
jgi:fermentation-respiration switch protein FrsA (DUF1100 family)